MDILRTQNLKLVDGIGEGITLVTNKDVKCHLDVGIHPQVEIQVSPIKATLFSNFHSLNLKCFVSFFL
jgi:hypothetical protein